MAVVTYILLSTNEKNGLLEQQELIKTYLGNRIPIKEFIETIICRPPITPVLTEAIKFAQKNNATLIIGSLGDFIKSASVLIKLQDVDFFVCDTNHIINKSSVEHLAKYLVYHTRALQESRGVDYEANPYAMEESILKKTQLVEKRRKFPKKVLTYYLDGHTEIEDIIEKFQEEYRTDIKKGKELTPQVIYQLLYREKRKGFKNETK